MKRAFLVLLVLGIAACGVTTEVEVRHPETATAFVGPHSAGGAMTSIPNGVEPPVEELPPSHVDRVLDSTELRETFVRAMKGWSADSSCPSGDLYPEGGYQTLWCHRSAVVTLQALAAASGLPIFTSGPHTPNDETLALGEEKSFGHYNPAFVKWFADSVVPQKDSASVRLTQAEYDASLKPLVTAFYKTDAKIRSEPGCFERERNAYKKLLDAQRLPTDYHNRWFYFMQPTFCPRMAQGLTDLRYFEDHGVDTGVNGNVALTVTGFFVRRSLDGTMPDFERALDKVVRAYQPELVR